MALVATRWTNIFFALLQLTWVVPCECFFWPWYTKNDPWHATAVPIESVETSLPLAPKDYPEAMQGMWWMDQAGVLAHTDVPHAAPDLALSFGDVDYSKLDRTTRTVKIDTYGPAWQWMNNEESYLFVRVGKILGYHYTFEWNEDYTFCYVKPTLTLPIIGAVSIPTWMMSFTVVKQKHEPGQCPPKEGASPKEFSACAEFDRQTYNLGSSLFGKYGIVHYYVFKIVDGDGNRIQPYYDAYVKHARNGSKYDPEAAKKFNMVIPEGAETYTLRPPPTASHVRYSDKRSEL